MTEIKLGDRLVIQNISEVYNSIFANVDNELIIDCSAIKQIDTTGIQLLIYSRNFTQNKTLTLVGHNENESIIGMANLLAVSDTLLLN